MKRGLNSGISNTIKREEYYNPQQSHNGQPQQQYNNRVFKNKKKAARLPHIIHCLLRNFGN